MGDIIHYDVEINPPVISSLVRRNIFREALQLYKSELANIVVVYDGAKNAYSPSPLPKDQFAFEVGSGGPNTLNTKGQQRQAEDPHSKEGETEAEEKQRSAKKKFIVTIKRVEVVNMSNLVQFLEGKINWTPYEAIHALEVVMRHTPSLVFVSSGRSFYSDNKVSPISGGAEVWEGYFQSIRPSRGKLLLNCDTVATAFYQPLNLIQFVKEVLRIRGDIQTISQREASQLDHELRNIAIKIIHRGAVKRKYKISCLANANSEQIFFETPDNGKISVAKYFQEKYKLRLKYPQLPCIQVAPTEKKIFLPLEVCEIVAGQKHMRKLSEDQTADMIKITCKRPQDRCQLIQQAYQAFKLDGNPTIDAFKIKIGRELTQVNGRILEPPTLFYGDKGKEPSINPQRGAWNLIEKSFDVPVVINSWAVINFSQRSPPKDVDRFIDELSNVARTLAINVKAVNPPVISDSGDYAEEAIKKAYRAAETAFKAPPQILLIILPTTSAMFYGNIKRICDTVLGISSQCLQSKHLARVSMPFCANLLMKINIKLGGINSHLGKQLSFINERPTIIFGADVTHPGVGEAGKPSIAALVATIDAKVSKYVSLVSIQESRMELIADLKNMVKAHLRSFYGATQRKPERIIFYRDGVSEGQFAQLLKTEVTSIKEACREIEKDYNPTITFVVIQKRHHVRFFPIDSKDADRNSGNIPAGTVVDTGICHPSQFDFFLCSHSGIQGTSKPAHYHVLFDENKFNADTFQELTYRLCYTFSRCTRSVSFVPPAYYAHLVAFRARFHFREESADTRFFCPVKPGIEKTMYFM